jgi:Ser/Thr protein kinase RdoA (MazF antagonist)
VHRTSAKHRREAAAYRAWAAQLAPQVAPLLAVRDAAPAAILLGHVPGRPGLPDDHPAAAAVHREAGAWLARLHRLPLADDDPVPVAEAYRRRADGWIARARRRLPGTILRSVRARLAETLPLLEGRRRVPCHRDMGPRNWLVADGRLGAVIDFEHARADVAEVDVARLSTTVWPARPELRAAFLAGYDAAGGPGDPEAPWAHGLLVLEALGTVVWAVEHGDASFERRGRVALAQLLDGTLA